MDLTQIFKKPVWALGFFFNIKIIKEIAVLLKRKRCSPKHSGGARRGPSALTPLGQGAFNEATPGERFLPDTRHEKVRLLFFFLQSTIYLMLLISDIWDFTKAHFLIRKKVNLWEKN